jgi:hypothetical protein
MLCNVRIIAMILFIAGVLVLIVSEARLVNRTDHTLNLFVMMDPWLEWMRGSRRIHHIWMLLLLAC